MGKIGGHIIYRKNGKVEALPQTPQKEWPPFESFVFREGHLLDIAAVVSYCTNDYRFIKRSLAEAKKFAKQLIVPVCDHFFDGREENRPLLEQTYRENPDTTFIEFAYSPEKLYTPFIKRRPEEEDWRILWHSTARYIAYFYLGREIEYLLFLDADEIMDGDRFTEWLSSSDISQYNALWFSAYQYGIKAHLRQNGLQETALLVKKRSLRPLQIFTAQERYGIFAAQSGPKRFQIVGKDGEPMIHHYSWVRPREECQKKSESWGKHHLEDWPLWIENAFAAKESGELVEPYFDPVSIEISLAETEGEFPNVIRVNEKILFQKELELLLEGYSNSE